MQSDKTNEEDVVVDYSYKGLVKEAKKRKKDKEFKDKIKSIGFSSIPGGVRHKT